MYRIRLEIEHLPEGPFLGTSPDLPGLVVQADSAEQVVALAPEIARDLLAVMAETGKAVPATVEVVPLTGLLPILVPA